MKDLALFSLLAGVLSFGVPSKAEEMTLLWYTSLREQPPELGARAL